jgi:DNA repair exonuclease SbcCD ATPase subunit
MLQRLQAHISACLDHALDAEERAKQASDPASKAEHSEMARRWRHLARSYEFVESLERFLIDSQKAKVVGLHRGTACPICGKQMQLISAEPTEHYVNLDLYRFGCDCGHSAETYVSREA